MHGDDVAACPSQRRDEIRAVEHVKVKTRQFNRQGDRFKAMMTGRPECGVLKALCGLFAGFSTVKHSITIFIIQRFQRSHEATHVGADTAFAIIRQSSVDADMLHDRCAQSRNTLQSGVQGGAQTARNCRSALPSLNIWWIAFTGTAMASPARSVRSSPSITMRPCPLRMK